MCVQKMSDRTPSPRVRLRRPPSLRRNRRRPRRRLNFDEGNNNHNNDDIPDDQRPDYDPNQARGGGENLNPRLDEPEQSNLKF